ncbi:glycosyltransferase family 2 protein [Oscillatoria salina]|uniref:glycosyltransferase family 2 protein n=1 Tax=Oscillatoria salina TaxID=331517 RepID=UPI0013BABFE7|nr:glycosyltransferase family 2 protein [Oscillatoria salina]MBZ8181005.1 glycosyltransferase family 2 protein [Oscillatoria salina IIICB1]NET88126.1 glycosyltransferase family 2 protein [Kamptonema sp. SIO1D9]
MKLDARTTKIKLPSFSIILETENLSTADLGDLYLSLNSLVGQNPSPAEANEVIIVDSGDTPQEVLQELRSRFPWLKLHQAPPGISYYQAKMEGAKVATGDIIVLSDSDCVYSSNWLYDILAAFTENPQVNVVAGETATRGDNPYGLAMHFAYIFNGFSGRKQAYESTRYYCNNVAFRRDFLLANPITSGLPLYRGNCSIHAESLIRQGDYILRLPKAQATHAPPNGWNHFFWRFLLIGRDNVLMQRLLNDFDKQPQAVKLPVKLKTRIGNLFPILRRVKNVRFLQLIYLPIAIPIALVSWLLIFCGRVITYFSPDYLLDVYSEVEGTVYEEKPVSASKELNLPKV